MLMYIDREWADLKNVVKFAAECARLALPFYEGDRRENLIAVIEAAEENLIGKTVCTFVYSAANRANNARTLSRVSGAVVSCARSAAHAARTARNHSQSGGLYEIDNTIRYAINAHYDAISAGVDAHETHVAFARCVVRDLSGVRELPEELRQAAGAAVVAGDEDLARALVQEDT